MVQETSFLVSGCPSRDMEVVHGSFIHVKRITKYGFDLLIQYDSLSLFLNAPMGVRIGKIGLRVKSVV